MEEEQCEAALSRAQCIYLDAKRRFEALDSVRDQLLARIDTGERTLLTAAEQSELDRLDREERTVYPVVLAAEAPLLATARRWLICHEEYCARHPECALLITMRIPAGMRDRALDLAAHIRRAEG